MSDISGFEEEGEDLGMPPPSVLRGMQPSGLIPLARVPRSSPAPAASVAKADPLVPFDEERAAAKKEPNYLGMFQQLTKSISDGNARKAKRDELNELLATMGQPTIPETPEVAAAQARVLDPTQAPEGGEPQIDVADIPSNYLARNRSAESGNDDTAVNKSTGAAGRYQFLPATAEGIRKANPHLNISDQWRTNAADQEKLMAAYTQQSVAALKKQLGRNPTGGELYMLHLLGHGGGSGVLGALDTPLEKLVSAEARRLNPVLQRYKTGKDLLGYFNKQFG